MSISAFREQMEQSNNVFLKTPHIFKPLQTLNAIILSISISSTAGTENGVLWFVVITSMLVSLIATALFALGIQDRIMENLSNGSIQWNTVELVYSFVFAVLSVICVWLSFGLASRNLGGTSMGYILAGLFSIVHAILYAIPCAVIYDSMNSSVMQPEQMNNIQTVHPFREYPYHDL